MIVSLLVTRSTICLGFIVILNLEIRGGWMIDILDERWIGCVVNMKIERHEANSSIVIDAIWSEANLNL